jgi:hypothetical protein
MTMGSGPRSRLTVPQADASGRDAGVSNWQLAECLLPGITPAIANAMGDRICAELARSPSAVSFVGSLLMPEDEVLLCLFAGPPADVRALSERAGLPFERILSCLGFSWTQPEPEKGQDGCTEF